MTPNRRSERVEMMKLGKRIPPIKCGLDVGIAGDNPPGANREFFTFADESTFQTMDKDASLNPDYVQDITQDIPEPLKHRFDLVCCTQTLEHVWELEKAFDGLWLLTGWDGHCIVDVPFLYPPHSDQRQDPDYWRLTPAALERHMRRAGFAGIEVWADSLWMNTHVYARKGIPG